MSVNTATAPVILHQIAMSSGLLAHRLGPLKAVVPSSPLLPILDTFLFEITDTDLTATASDNEVFLSTEMPVDRLRDLFGPGTEDFSCCVPAKLLVDLLDRLPEQLLTLCFDEELTELTIKADKGVYELPLLPSETWPHSTEATPGIRFELPADQLAHALAHTAFATSTDESRPPMTGVHIESKLGLRFVSTDGHRIVKVDRPDAGIPECSAILPRKPAALLASLLGEYEVPVQIEITPTTAQFVMNGYQMLTRLIDAKYPNVTGAFTHNPYLLDCETKELINVLKTMMLFTFKETSVVSFELSRDDSFVVGAFQDTLKRRATQTVDGNWDGDEMKIGFNGKLLIGLLEHVETLRVSLAISAPSKQVIITGLGTEQTDVTVTSLIMPVVLGLDSFA